MNKIHHLYRPEILVPLCAVEGNLDLLFHIKGCYVTSDGVEVEAVLIKTIHALDVECQNKVKDIYGVTAANFLCIWYDRMGWRFNSNELLNIKLIKKND